MPSTNPDRATEAQHYAHDMVVPVTQADLDRGYALVRLDPYRLCRFYDLPGGPPEHMTKKLLRGARKGHSDEQLRLELRQALDRWDAMEAEDARAAFALIHGHPPLDEEDRKP